MSAPSPKPAWVKYVCLIAGLGLILAACYELYMTYAVVWPQWQKAKTEMAKSQTPPAAPGVKTAPGAAKPATPPAAAPAAPAITLPQLLSRYTVVLARDAIFLIVGVGLVVYSGRNPRQTSTSAAMEAAQLSPGGLTVSTALPAFTPVRMSSGPTSKRWQFCNIIQLNEAGRKLWTFTAGKGGFGQGQEHTIPATQPLPAFVKRDWKSLVQPKLNIAWLPVEQVFLRVVQLPGGDFNETLAMVELQLEKISPLPVTQIVWSIEIMPQKAGDLQTVVVIIVSRDLVEQFLGDLEQQGFLAHRLELPLLDQLLATKITEDGAYLYPENNAEKISALVAWWYGGVLRNLGLVRLPVTADPAAALKEQLAQMAWSGELEGWLHKTPRWHLVADNVTATQWQSLFAPWLDEPVPVYLPLTLPQLALTNANRAARADLGIGILPPEYFTRYKQEFVDGLWMRGLFTALGVYCAGVIIYLAAVNWQSMGMDELQQRRASLSREYTNTLRIKAQMEILLNRQALKFASLDCWEKTAEYLPEGVTIQNLDFKDGRHLSLSGTAGADKADAITDFNDNLRKATLNDKPMFEKLDLPVTKLGQGNLSWSFSGELSHAEELK